MPRRTGTGSSAGRWAAGLLLLAVLAGSPWTAPASAADPVVAAVGDIACSPSDPSYNGGAGTATACRQQPVSDLLAGFAPDAVLLLGDNQYDSGSLAEYNAVFDSTVGRANAIAWPVLGNSEYVTANAGGFFDYFTTAGVLPRIASTATDASRLADGYYSFQIGSWHVIALNSNCAQIGGCQAGSAQEQWLKADLAAHPADCTLAFWHHPRWNTGDLGNETETSAFWSDLYDANADVVLNGHGNHHYERFTPQNPSGDPDPVRGIREFIVSTGGQSHGTPMPSPPPSRTSEVSDYTTYGALRMTLHATSYAWAFAPAAGGTFSDSGSASCHSSAPPPPPPPAPTPKVATELSVSRLLIDRHRHRLQLRAAIRSPATGSLGVALRAAGRRTTFKVPVGTGAIHVDRSIARASSRRSGLLTIAYPGDARVRAMTVRLRTGTRRARLRLQRPNLANGRLEAIGTITSRARGHVLVELQYQVGAVVDTLRFRAPIRDGLWRLARNLPASALARIAARTGTVHSYVLYAGDRRRQLSGELRSYRVLGSR